MLCLPISELAHIFHRDLLSVFRPVNPPGQVADTPVLHTDKCMGNGLKLMSVTIWQQHGTSIIDYTKRFLLQRSLGVRVV